MTAFGVASSCVLLDPTLELRLVGVGWSCSGETSVRFLFAPSATFKDASTSSVDFLAADLRVL